MSAAGVGFGVGAGRGADGLAGALVDRDFVAAAVVRGLRVVVVRGLVAGFATADAGLLARELAVDAGLRVVVRGLVAGLATDFAVDRGLAAVTFVDAAPDAADAGLAPPARFVTVRAAEPAAAPAAAPAAPAAFATGFAARDVAAPAAFAALPAALAAEPAALATGAAARAVAAPTAFAAATGTLDADPAADPANTASFSVSEATFAAASSTWRRRLAICFLPFDASAAAS